MIEFILPILSPEKPKRLNITMANTLFEAMCGVRPVNWGRLIQEYVEKSLPHIGRKPSFHSPYILHFYQQHGCINKAKEDALTIAEDEVVYKLGPKVELTEAETEESSEDPVAPEPPLPYPIPSFAPAPKLFRRQGELPPHGLEMKVDSVESSRAGTSNPPLGSLRKLLSSESGQS
jgi:hypothetical protein